MAKKRYYDSIKGGGMINEDMSQMANLPQGVVMKGYPKVSYSMYPELIDTISGVDGQMMNDKKGGKKGSNPEKY
jgi:hypothetical protein